MRNWTTSNTLVDNDRSDLKIPKMKKNFEKVFWCSQNESQLLIWIFLCAENHEQPFFGFHFGYIYEVPLQLFIDRSNPCYYPLELNNYFSLLLLVPLSIVPSTLAVAVLSWLRPDDFLPHTHGFTRSLHSKSAPISIPVGKRLRESCAETEGAWEPSVNSSLVNQVSKFTPFACR